MKSIILEGKTIIVATKEIPALNKLIKSFRFEVSAYDILHNTKIENNVIAKKLPINIQNEIHLVIFLNCKI